MSVSVYMMSGEIISINIFEGFSVRNLRNVVYTYLCFRNNQNIQDSNRLIFSKIGEDQEVDNYTAVRNGDSFRVFVNPDFDNEEYNEDYDPEIDADGDNVWD